MSGKTAGPARAWVRVPIAIVYIANSAGIERADA